MPAALAMVLPFALYLPAQSLRSFFGSMLNAEQRYAWPTIAGAAGAAVTLAAIAGLRGALSIVAVPCGWLAGEIAAAAVLCTALRSARVAIRPNLARPDAVR